MPDTDSNEIQAESAGLYGSDDVHRAAEVDEPMPLSGDEAKQDDDKNTLGARLRDKFGLWRDAKRQIEDKWLRHLRAFNSQYEPGEIAEARSQKGNEWKRSTTYIGLTKTKTRAQYARLVNLEFPGSGKKNWDVTPTPIPSLFLAPEKLIPKQEMAKLNGLPPTEKAALLEKLIEKEAAERARRMVRAIEDSLVEANYDIIQRDAELERCILGTGAIKGVLPGTEVKSAWLPDENGDWVRNEYEAIVPRIGSVSCFDLYPDPDATTVQDMYGIFERHLFNRAQFRALGDYKSFDDSKIAEIIRLSPSGNHDRSDVDIQKQQIAKIDPTLSSGRYEVLEYWGYIDDMDLAEAGIEPPKVRDDNVARTYEYLVEIWICGGEVIKAVLAPYIPYMICPFERVSGQLWGDGIPEMMQDSQRIVNGAARTMEDNMAIASGPMGEINADMLDPNSTLADQVAPWKLFVRHGGDASTPLIRWHVTPSILPELLSVIQAFRTSIDDETNLPSYAQGENSAGGSGVHRTSSGMSMLMGAANISLFSLVKNSDDYLRRPLIQRLYDFLMEYSTDNSIKGDMNIEAKGVASLIAKEIQSQILLSFLQTTANPLDQRYVNRPELLRRAAEAMDIAHLGAILTDEEIQAAEQNQQPDPSEQANIALSNAQAEDAMSRAKLNMARVDEILANPQLGEQERITKLQNLQADTDKKSASALQHKVLAMSREKEDALNRAKFKKELMDSDLEAQRPTPGAGGPQ